MFFFVLACLDLNPLREKESRVQCRRDQLFSNQVYRKNKCHGWRPVIAWEKRGKLDVPTKEDMQWRTYGEVDVDVRCMSQVLLECGLKKGGFFAIFDETRPEWSVCSHAAFRQGITVVTCYATLGAEVCVVLVLKRSNGTVVASDTSIWTENPNPAPQHPGSGRCLRT